MRHTSLSLVTTYLIILFALHSAVKVRELYPGPQETAEKQNAAEYQ